MGVERFETIGEQRHVSTSDNNRFVLRKCCQRSLTDERSLDCSIYRSGYNTLSDDGDFP